MVAFQNQYLVKDRLEAFALLRPAWSWLQRQRLPGESRLPIAVGTRQDLGRSS